MGSKFKKVASFTSLTGALTSRKGKDLLFGKKDPGVADKFLALDPSLAKTVELGRKGQQNILSAAGRELAAIKAGPSARGLAGITAAKQERQIRAGAQDQARRAGDLVAQRGLGSSSVGLRALLAPGRDVGRRIGQIRAATPLLEQQFRSQRIGQIGTIGGVLGTPGAQRAFIQGRASTGRSGGLAKLGLTAAGAFFGGPAGAQAGAGFGQSLANL